MEQYYLIQNDTQQGPFTLSQLSAMWSGGFVTSNTLCWKEGFSEWIPISRIIGELECKPSPTGPQQETRASLVTENIPAVLVGVRELGVHSLQKVKGSASSILSDLRSVDFKEEVLPVNKQLVERMFADSSFWIVMGLAAVPLLIVTLERTDFQLTAFALFFAAIWGFIFKSLIIPAKTSWRVLVAPLFFTGSVGIPSLLFSYDKFLPTAFTAMASSSSGVTSLLGYVFQVGVCEELIKIVPVVIYLAWKRNAASPLVAILVGIFSGLGFAAFENMSYGQSAIFRSAVLAKKAGQVGAAVGTRGAMINVMLRSLSLVFCHAIFSGIFAYFVTTGFAAKRRFVAMSAIGLGVSAVLHGAYDWLTGVQMTAATGVVIFSFVLFYSYLIKLRQLLEPDSSVV
jgi:RsiW-degrading membrane proteinase PrsW (M82 family)